MFDVHHRLSYFAPGGSGRDIGNQSHRNGNYCSSIEYNQGNEWHSHHLGVIVSHGEAFFVLISSIMNPESRNEIRMKRESAPIGLCR